jgi:hypothetical protein
MLNNRRDRLISKSRYVNGLQCPKLLWTHYNAKDRIPPFDPETLAIFAQGHEVGRLAQQTVPCGEEVPFGSIAKTVARTNELLKHRKPIYEASFAAGNVYCRVDILRPVERGKWDLLEVKSATKVKDVNIDDIAVQAHAAESAGLRLDRLYLVHIDNDYVRMGDIDPMELFHAEDVTDRVRQSAPQVAPNLERFLKMLDGPEPDTPIGAHCEYPYPCPLKPRCWAHVPKDDPTTLMGAGQKGTRWVERGITRAVDVPDDELTDRQRVQVKALDQAAPHVEPAPIREWLDRLEYPLTLLDFEAFAPAVPLLQGTSPFESIPFQASVHLIDAEGAEPTHRDFLDPSRDDPRPALADFLATLPAKGSVLAWNASYERRILRRLSADFPAHAAALLSLDRRLRDLMDPFKNLHYYHPAQRGSASIKAVLPALTGDGYQGDAIEGGRQAANEYVRVVYGDVSDTERDAVLQSLREYCRKDTWSMMEILRILEKVG